jgi:chromosome segregation ATPase
MGKRRKVAISDSLDLFLDTICNAFGGLLFLAILLTLLVQMRSADNSGTAKQTVSTTAFEKLALEVRTAERRREELKAQVLKLKQTADAMAAGPIQQRATSVEDVQKKNEELNAQIQSETKQVESMLQEMREIQEQMANLKVELPRVREDLARAENNLTEELKSREQSVEAPVERVTMKAPLCLLMRYNRVYVVFRDDANQNVNQEHVEDLSKGQTTIVRPKSGNGWDIVGISGLELLKDLFARKSSADTFCSIGVWPDSYGNFEKVKKMMIDGGFNYQLIPLTTEERVSYGVSDQPALVQ